MADRDRVTAIALAKAASPWLETWVLEALDTIDKARELHREHDYHSISDMTYCRHCDLPWPCPTWQVLNGGNESGGDA